jgi:hypothetical protein
LKPCVHDDVPVTQECGSQRFGSSPRPTLPLSCLGQHMGAASLGLKEGGEAQEERQVERSTYAVGLLLGKIEVDDALAHVLKLLADRFVRLVPCVVLQVFLVLKPHDESVHVPLMGGAQIRSCSHRHNAWDDLSERSDMCESQLDVLL